MTDDDFERVGKTDWIKFRVEPARKTAWEAAADAVELDFSEWAREALDERLHQQLGITVGPPAADAPIVPFRPATE